MHISNLLWGGGLFITGIFLVWHGRQLLFYTEDYFNHVSDEFGNKGKKAAKYFFLDYETSIVIHKVRGVLFIIIGVVFIVLVVIRICLWLFPSLVEIFGTV